MNVRFAFPLFFGALALSLGSASCASESEDEASEDELTAKDPKNLNMPKAIKKYENDRNWGGHHVEWHVERRWDRLDADGKRWAESKGYSRASLQEGATGNGLEFLAMHRAMMECLRRDFPSWKYLFDGWATVPLKHSAENPVNSQDRSKAISGELLTSIQTLQNVGNVCTAFATDDAFGLYVETTLRTGSTPAREGSGAHNALHVRFSDDDSPINVGDPALNLQNKVFWRIHGWLDARWNDYRTCKGFKDTDTKYAAAMAAARAHVAGLRGTGLQLPKSRSTMPGSVVDDFFKND